MEDVSGPQRGGWLVWDQPGSVGTLRAHPAIYAGTEERLRLLRRG